MSSDYQLSHPLCCSVFGCNVWASHGYGSYKGKPGAGIWVCGSPLHRAWAIGVLEARKRLSLATERAPKKEFTSPKPAPAKPPSLFDEVPAL